MATLIDTRDAVPEYIYFARSKNQGDSRCAMDSNNVETGIGGITLGWVYENLSVGEDL